MGRIKPIVEEEIIKLINPRYILTKAYRHKTSHTVTMLECSRKHEIKTTVDHLKKIKKTNPDKELCVKCRSFDKFMDDVEQSQYTIVEGEYKNSTNSTFIIKCKNNHKIKLRYGDQKKHLNSPCHKCNLGGKTKVAENDLFKLFDNLGYKLKSDFKGYRTQILVECENGHEWKTYYYTIKRGSRCIHCFRRKTASEPELEIYSWLQNLGVKVEKQYLLGNYIFDLFLPEYGLIIDYHGLFWHSLKITEVSKKGPSAKLKKYRHHYKYKVAKANNFKLLQIWSDDWDDRKDVVKSLILGKLNKHEKIFARKCELQNLDPKQCQKFLDENHLQGKGSWNLKMCIGLVHEGDLVMALSIASHHRDKDTNVINRICSKKGITVIGGMSKLLTKVPQPIATWSDNLYSDGDAYKNLGFTFAGDVAVGYFYTDGHKRISKQNLEKTKEEQKLDKTEFQLRHAQGYRIIFDAGKKKWVLGNIEAGKQEDENENKKNEIPIEHVINREALRYESRKKALENANTIRTENYKNFLSEKGYILLSETATSARMILEIQCSKGHIFKNSYSNLRRKEAEWCFTCEEHFWQNPKEFTPDLEAKINEYGFTYHSGEYTNSKSRFKVKCIKEGCEGITEIVFDDRKKYKCPECSKRKRAIKSKELKIKYINGKAEKNNVNVISYEYGDKSVGFQCKQCGSKFSRSVLQVHKVNCPSCK
jgi:G:T-mismatch repair DNA endonuclease (very short patch repair protein)